MKDNKLEIRIISLLNHISYVQNDLNNVSFEEFKNSSLLQRATCFSIVQIGETMNKLEPILKNKYPDLPWIYARTMRNFIVHDYDNVDALEVYRTATIDLEELKMHISNIHKDILKENEK